MSRDTRQSSTWVASLIVRNERQNLLSNCCVERLVEVLHHSPAITKPGDGKSALQPAQRLNGKNNRFQNPGLVSTLGEGGKPSGKGQPVRWAGQGLERGTYRTMEPELSTRRTHSITCGSLLAAKKSGKNLE